MSALIFPGWSRFQSSLGKGEGQWIKLWREERGSFAQLPLIARGLFSEMLKLTDESGHIDIGTKEPWDAIAFALGADRADRRALKKYIPMLLEDGCIVHRRGNEATTTEPRSDHDRTTNEPPSNHEATTTEPRSDHDRTTNEPPSNHEATTTEPRSDHDRTTNEPPSNHEATTTEPRSDHDRTTNEPPSNHEATTTEPRSDHEGGAKYAESHSAHSVLFNYKEEEKDKEEENTVGECDQSDSEADVSDTEAARWKHLDESWRKRFGSGLGGLFDAKQASTIRKLRESMPTRAEWDSEVFSFVEFIASNTWRPNSVWSYFAKNAGGFRLKHAAISKKRKAQNVHVPEASAFTEADMDLDDVFKTLEVANV